MPETIDISFVGPDQRLALGAATRAAASLAAIPGTMQPFVDSATAKAEAASDSASAAAGTLSQTQLLLAEAAVVSPAVPAPRCAQALVDSTGRVISGVDSTAAKLHFPNINTRLLNGRRPEALTLRQPMYGGGPMMASLLASMLYILNAGQSRAAGNAYNIVQTTVQPGRAVAYPNGSMSPTATYPLVASNPIVTGYVTTTPPTPTGDFPTMGLFEFLYELLAKENGINPLDVAMVPTTANTGEGSHAISTLNKGNAIYSLALQQVARMAATDAPALNLKARSLGVFWAQGEADTNNGYAYYLNALGTLAQNFSTDFLSELPNQPASLIPTLVACSVDTYGPGSDRFGVTRAILQLAINYAAGVAAAPPVGFSTPTYQMDTREGAGTHLAARDAKWLGAYAALYFKRVFFDGASWAPMVPAKVEIENGAMFITHQMRAPNAKLVVAETLDVNQTYNGKVVYQQAGRGYSGVDASGNALTFSQLPDVVGPQTIRLIPTVAPASIARLDYGQQQAVNMYPFGIASSSAGSGCGNFRDNYGDLVFYDGANGPASAVNRRMDNWMPVHSIVPASNSTGFSWPTA